MLLAAYAPAVSPRSNPRHGLHERLPPIPAVVDVDSGCDGGISGCDGDMCGGGIDSDDVVGLGVAAD